ncbi:MAG: hypothetical protein JWM69_207 [Candidatus Binatus sp.]|nr:hypothetical protein [Candidatus Binatus sp.]
MARAAENTNAPRFFVDARLGNDANSGTSRDSPWRSLAKINQTSLAPGTAVYLKRGEIWRETLEPKNGGAPNRPVTFTAYGAGPQPIISGSDLITGWTRVGEGPIYRARSDRPGNLYVDGGPGWGLAQACCRERGSCERSAACAIAPMRAGSWYFDSRGSALYLWLSDGSNPAAHKVEAAVREYGFKAIANGGEKGHLVIDGLTFERTRGYGIYIFSNGEGGAGPAAVVVRNNTVRQTGTGTIDDGQYYNAISYSGGHGNAINSQNADGARLIGNRADHFNHSGFDVKNSSGVEIRGNLARDSVDANGIYLEYSPRSLIVGNSVYGLAATKPGQGSGIQLEEGSEGAMILNNSVADVFTGIYLNVPATARCNSVVRGGNAALEANRGGLFDHNLWSTRAKLLLNGRRYDLSEWRAISSHTDDVAIGTESASAHFSAENPLPSPPCSATVTGQIHR